MPTTAGLLIVDFGSQYTLLIAKRLRESGIYSEIVAAQHCSLPPGLSCAGLILSGGPGFIASTTSEHHTALLSWVQGLRVPILGICYGMQLLVAAAGGELRSHQKSECGHATLDWLAHENSFGKLLSAGLPEQHSVWMSHFDDIKSLPRGFEVIARTAEGVIAAVCHQDAAIAAVQFHPEVSHTAYGATLLRNFAQGFCKLTPAWQMEEFLPRTIARLQAEIPPSARVLVAVSGGVDSSVLALLLKKALGNQRVSAVMVDSGLQRRGEVSWVREQFAALGFSLQVIPASREFFAALHGVAEPEAKRKIIGHLFIRVLSAFARDHGPFAYLGQGTLYPDVIESAGGASGAQVIKSHHNVGGLPESLALTLLEPLRFLFKDEVRRLGVLLELPAELVNRHPFPGPGLAVRIPGAVTAAAVETLQHADAIFTRALKEAGYYAQIWQAAAILLPVKSVGVMGDNRTYQQVCVLRAVLSEDGMTATVSELPLSFLTATAGKIIAEVPGINRVLYDVTSKPPATIEWE